MMKLASVKLFDKIKDDDSVTICAVVHDEFVIEAPADKCPHLSNVVRDCMEEAGRELLSDVPIIAEPKVGPSWGECH